MRVAVVGSRDFRDYSLLKQEVVDFILKYNLDKTDIMIVSAGHPGQIPWERKISEEMEWDLLVFRAQWQKHSRKAGMLRNKKIVENADALIAFRINNSKGTTNSIELAREKGIKVRVVDL